MEIATRGSRLILWYFWRLVVCVNLICSPSHKNHMGDDCGSPLGPMVARCAYAFDCRIFSTFGLFKTAIKSNLSTLSLLEGLESPSYLVTIPRPVEWEGLAP